MSGAEVVEAPGPQGFAAGKSRVQPAAALIRLETLSTSLDRIRSTVFACAIRLLLRKAGCFSSPSRPGRGERFLLELIWRYDSVENPDFDGAARVVDRRLDQSPIEVTLRQAGSRDLEGEVGQRHPDRGLVHAELEGAIRTDALVRGHREESAHRNRVPAASHDHGLRVIVDVRRQSPSCDHHVARGLRALPHRRQVESAAEHPVAAKDHDRAHILRIGRLGQLLAECLCDCLRDRVGLPVIQPQDADSVLEAVLHVRHRELLPFFASTKSASQTARGVNQARWME